MSQPNYFYDLPDDMIEMIQNIVEVERAKEEIRLEVKSYWMKCNLRAELRYLSDEVFIRYDQPKSIISRGPWVQKMFRILRAKSTSYREHISRLNHNYTFTLEGDDF
jgi:hypothetical protein